MKLKKILALCLAVSALVMLFAGCGQQKASDGKVTISISNWPSPESKELYERYEQRIAGFNEKFPNIEIKPDTYAYNTKDFVAKAMGNQLPTVFMAPFTEAKTIPNGKYCADVSGFLKDSEFFKMLNPQVLDFVKGDNGEIWGIPYTAYAQGLYINKAIFKEAGLVNDDGSVKIPQTYDEMAEFAAIIRQKTGKAGYVMPTIENCGGWHFMNVAWSYGTKFMEQDSNGKWSATFDSPEFKAACQWLYDMKWKYNAFPEQSAVSNAERAQIFGTGQAAMMFADPPSSDLSTKYGMKIEDIMCARMPAGPVKRAALMGGSILFFSKNITKEQFDACMNWYKYLGVYTTEFTDDDLVKAEETYQDLKKQNQIILPKTPMPIILNQKNADKAEELQKKCSNVAPEDYEDYFSFKDVELTTEEPACCQQLYAVLDGVIQKIMTDKNVNIDEITKTAVNDFQKNHLDNLK